jgi:hypothetical protein
MHTEAERTRSRRLYAKLGVLLSACAAHPASESSTETPRRFLSTTVPVVVAAAVRTAPPPTASERASAETPTANLDPSDDDVVGPPVALPDCEARLRAAEIKFEPASLPLFEKRGVVCGAPQAIKYLRGSEGSVFSPRPIVTCQLALGLAEFEKLAQRLSRRYFGVRIKSIKQGGTYNCRSMARFKLVSEHSYANAIDVYEFALENGKKINVLRHFGKPEQEPRAAEGRFLRELARAAFDEKLFSVVVTRYFDELHRDHIHLDMAHYRTDGTR